MSELLFLRQLLGEGAQGWVQAALLGGLFAVLIARPDRIRNRSLLVLASLLLALAIVAGPVVALFHAIVPPRAGMYSTPGLGMDSFTFGLLNLVGPLCFALAVLCSLLAILPARERPSTAPPPKHPLE